MLHYITFYIIHYTLYKGGKGVVMDHLSIELYRAARPAHIFKQTTYTLCCTAYSVLRKYEGLDFPDENRLACQILKSPYLYICMLPTLVFTILVPSNLIMIQSDINACIFF